jgi:hypothetical protein
MVTQMTAIDDNPPVRKEAAGKLAHHECWPEIMRENVLDARAINGIPVDLQAWTSISRDETESTEQVVNERCQRNKEQ